MGTTESNHRRVTKIFSVKFQFKHISPLTETEDIDPAKEKKKTKTVIEMNNMQRDMILKEEGL